MNPTFDDAAPPDGLRIQLDRIQRLALLVGGAGLLACLAARFLWPAQFAPAYLVAFLFWVGIGLGSLGLGLLHHLVGGQWGLPIRRPLEAGAMTLLPLAILFLPLALDLPALYPWARPEELSHDPELAHKTVYLDPSFFLIRAAGYFVVWIAMALLLSRKSRAQDESPEPRPSVFLQNLSGPGLALLFLTSTFAAIDWGMSLEPKWASTIYGAMLITGEALATLALMIVVSSLLAIGPPMREAATPPRLHDLGNLLLAFVMLWAYMAFSQFLIIWSGNLREEVPWYIRRTHGGWEWAALTLIVVHFFLPFFVLLFRESKRHRSLLVRVAVLIIVMHLVDLVWLVLPATSGVTSPGIPWGQLPLVLVATIGVGGFWLAAFLGFLKTAPLIPARDPHVLAALQHSGGV